MTVVTYRTDDLGRWGAGKGSNLSAGEIDGNFWELAQRLVAIEGGGVAGNGIASISVVGSQMTIHLEDETTRGPFTLPTAMIRYRGDWVAGAAYSELDVIAAPGQAGLYLAARDHVAAAQFDPEAVDLEGRRLYQWLFPMTEAGNVSSAKLGDLSNVRSWTPDNGDVLVWSAADEMWYPGSRPSALRDLDGVWMPQDPTEGQVLGFDGWNWTAIDQTGGGGGEVGPAGTHRWRLVIRGDIDGFASFVEIQFRTAAGVSRPATDGTPFTLGWNSVERAFDGSDTTYASRHMPKDGDYLGVGFGSLLAFQEIAIKLYNSTLNNFDVEYSADGVAWRRVAEVRGAGATGGYSGFQWFTFPLLAVADAPLIGAPSFRDLADIPATIGAIPAELGSDGQVLKVSGGGLVWAADEAGAGGGGASVWADLAEKPATVEALPAELGANGQVLKVADGGLVWAADEAGSGGGGATAWADLAEKPATVEALPAELGANGQVLKVADGGLVWAADEAGAGGGGASVWADLAEKPATVEALPAELGSDGQVLKVAGGALVWAADEAGSGGAGGGLPGAADPHKFWRVYIAENLGANYTGLSEVEFRPAPGGAKHPTVGGTVLFSSQFGSGSDFAATGAFDGDPVTRWITTASGKFPAIIGYEFPEPVIVREVLLQAVAAGDPQYSPRYFAVQFSDDGMSWAPATGLLHETGWVLGEERVFAVAAAGDSGSIPATFWGDVAGKPATAEALPAELGANGQVLKVADGALVWAADEAGAGGGGASSFLELSDTPASFGSAGQLAAVNPAGDGLVFVDPPEGGSGGASAWAEVSGKPATIEALPAAVGAAGQVLKVQPDGSIAWAEDEAGAGGEAGGGSHRYWRVYISANHDSYVTGLAEVEFRPAPGAPKHPTTGGTVLFSSQYSPFDSAAAEAFDGDPETSWYTSMEGATPAFIGYAFADPVAVGEVMLQGAAWDPPSSPRILQIEWSDDGETWSPAGPVEELAPWGNDEQRVFAVGAASGGGAASWSEIGGKPATVEALPAELGSDGQVLKVAGGSLVWAADEAGSGGGGGASAWSDISDKPATAEALPAALGSAGQVLKVQPDGSLGWSADEAGGEAPGGFPGAGDPHTHWRVYITGNHDGSFSMLGEVQFRSAPGAVKHPTTGGSFLRSTESSTGWSDYAFDGNPETHWATASGQALPSFIGYAFPSPVPVGEVMLQAPRTNVSSAPRTFEVQFSDDGVVWSTAAVVEHTPEWDLYEARTFAVVGGGTSWADVGGKPATVAALPAAVGSAGQILEAQSDGSLAWAAPPARGSALKSAHGAHRHWRINATSNFGSNTAYRIAEFGLFAAADGSGPNLATGKVPAGSSSASGSALANAVDGNPATFWRSLSAGSIQFGVDLVEPAAIQSLSIEITDDNLLGGPRLFSVQWSDNGSTWTTAWSVHVDFAAPYEAGVRKVFTDPGLVPSGGILWSDVGGKPAGLEALPAEVGAAGQVLQAQPDGSVAWASAGAATWADLEDKPAVLEAIPAELGANGHVLKVSAGGLVWAPDLTGGGEGGGASSFLELADTPFAFGSAGQIPAVNAAGDGLEFVDPPSGGGDAPQQRYFLGAAANPGSTPSTTAYASKASILSLRGPITAISAVACLVPSSTANVFVVRICRVRADNYQVLGVVAESSPETGISGMSYVRFFFPEPVLLPVLPDGEIYVAACTIIGGTGTQVLRIVATPFLMPFALTIGATPNGALQYNTVDMAPGVVPGAVGTSTYTVWLEGLEEAVGLM